MRARSRIIAPFVFFAALAMAPMIVHAAPGAGDSARSMASATLPGGQTLAAESAALTRDLATFAQGLESSLAADDVATAENLYELEVRATRLLVATGAAKFTSAEARAEALADARSMVGRILRFQERVQAVAIVALDKALPGEPPRKGWTRAGVDLVRPLFRMGTPQPGVPVPTPLQAYAQMKADFTGKGGKSSDFHMLGARTIEKIPSDTLVEWTQFGQSDVRFTSAGAKHPVIGLGRSVRGAGSLRVFRANGGEVLLVIVSNSSGNYKPGAGSTEGVVQRLVDIGVPARKIVVTSVIPGEPELAKLLMKARKTFTKEQIADRAAALVARAKGTAPLAASTKPALSTTAGTTPQSTPAEARAKYIQPDRAAARVRLVRSGSGSARQPAARTTAARLPAPRGAQASR